MRLWLLLFIVAAGCVKVVDPGPGEFRTCPAWQVGKSSFEVTQSFSDAGSTNQRDDQLVGPPQDIGPLDRIAMEFRWVLRDGEWVPRGVETMNSTLRMELESQGKPVTGVWGQERGDSFLFEGLETNFTIIVETGEPVTVTWKWLPDADPTTKSLAVANYVARFQYKVC